MLVYQNTVSLGTVYYNKGKESNNILLMSDHKNISTEKGVINPQLTEEQLCIMSVAIMLLGGGGVYPWLSIEILN